MPKNGKTSNSQTIEKQRKFFKKNFKKNLYKNVRLCVDFENLNFNTKKISAKRRFFLNLQKFYKTS